MIKKPLTLTAARRIAEGQGAKQIIVLLFDGVRFSGTSYGHTRASCAEVGRTLDAIVADLGAGRIPAPRIDGEIADITEIDPRYVDDARRVLDELEAEPGPDDGEWRIATGTLRAIARGLAR